MARCSAICADGGGPRLTSSTINNGALPVAIRLETGEGLDDIEVTQSNRGAI